MQGHAIAFPDAASYNANLILSGRAAENHYDEIEKQFSELIFVDELDKNLSQHAATIARFEAALTTALTKAFSIPFDQPDIAAEHDIARAHSFLHRVLYQINRLNFFWYDALCHYNNERSNYLRGVRDRIEEEWQRWELSQLDMEAIKNTRPVDEALQQRAAADLDPEPSADGLYFRDQVGISGYRRLLEIASLDGLVEASQLSRTMGGVANEIHAMMTRLLVEEYGGGKLPRKHSSFFTVMLEELGMKTEPEAYLSVVPWEVLANINHSFLLSERRRFYLRYIGGLLYTEISVPAGFRYYRSAAARLGLSERAMGYWDLHIREDERHGQWMLHRISFPLAERYPQDAWELVLGYDQQRYMSARSGAAVARAAREAEREAEPSILKFRTAVR